MLGDWREEPRDLYLAEIHGLPVRRPLPTAAIAAALPGQLGLFVHAKSSLMSTSPVLSTPPTAALGVCPGADAAGTFPGRNQSRVQI
jgi:hypothetical protein